MVPATCVRCAASCGEAPHADFLFHQLNGPVHPAWIRVAPRGRERRPGNGRTSLLLQLVRHRLKERPQGRL